MSQQPDPSLTLGPQAVRVWDRFWFDPVRPTSLGVIRICTGLIVLYVHFLYTFQLQEFFGKDAWVDLRMANMMRHESPLPHLPSDWTPAPTAVTPAQTPGEAQALDRYKEEWGGLDPRLNASQGTPIWS